MGVADRGFFDELEALFTNSGKLITGPGSTLDVPGTYIQEASGTFTTQVGGTPASGQFGRLIGTSPMTLDGSFGVELTSGFAPTTGEQFPVITFPSCDRQLRTVTGLSGGRRPLFTVDQLPTGVVLSAVGTAVDLAFDGFELPSLPRRRRGRSSGSRTTSAI